MSIDSIGPATTTGATTQSGRTQAAQDFAALAQALQQGDLSAAQQAFATLSQDVPWVGRVASGQSTDGTSATASTGAGPVSSAIQGLASALQSGDLAGAQKAFAALQQAQGGGHHHGHHHHHADAQASSSTTTTPTPAVTATSGGTVDTLA